MASVYMVLQLTATLSIASLHSDFVYPSQHLAITAHPVQPSRRDSVRLKCLWTPTDYESDALEYTWDFHRAGTDKNITITDGHQYSIKKLDDPHGSRVEVNQVQQADVGTYYCTTSIHDLLYSAGYELTIEADSSEISSPSMEMTLDHGESSTQDVDASVHFQCKVHGAVTINITWGFGNLTPNKMAERFPHVHSIRTDNALSVELSNLRLDQNGTYHCWSVELGLHETLDIRVVGIDIQCQGDTLKVRADEDANILCYIISIPDVDKIEWNINKNWNQLIQQSNKYSIEQSNQMQGRMTTTLIITDVQHNDEAEYTVTAITRRHSDQETVALSIDTSCPRCQDPMICGVQGQCQCPETMKHNPNGGPPACVVESLRPADNRDGSSGHWDTERNGDDVVISQTTVAWVIGASIGTLALIVTVIIGFVCYRRRKNIPLKMEGIYHDPTYRYEYHSEANVLKELPQFFNPGYQTSPHRDTTTKENAYISLSRVKLEFPRQHLQLGADLGQGRFGKVIQALAKNISGNGQVETVAVKTCRATATDAEKEDLYQELDIMRKMPWHTNVIALLRCCAQTDPLYIIMEYAHRGSMLKYLRQCRPSSRMSHLSDISIVSRSSSFMQPRAKDLTIFALHVARGMAHVASCGIIHRDLAARNVLLSSDFTCKICDFGLARDVEGVDVYERTSKGPLPIRWMAPEALEDNCYTRKSDVWSYGILLWEIVTLGATPYSGVSAMEVMRQVLNGRMLQRPLHCKEEMYELMVRCWTKEKERPSFSDLVMHYEALMDDDYILLGDYEEDDYDWLDSYTLEERV